MSVRSSSGGKADWSAAGTVYTNIPEVRRWEINPQPEVKTYASSSTAGAKRRLPGNDDFTGTMTLYVDEGNRFDAMFKAGDTGFFKLFEDADDFFIAPVYIDSTNEITDIEGGEIIGATVNFSSDGVLQYPT